MKANTGLQLERQIPVQAIYDYALAAVMNKFLAVLNATTWLISHDLVVKNFE